MSQFVDAHVVPEHMKAYAVILRQRLALERDMCQTALAAQQVEHAIATADRSKAVISKKTLVGEQSEGIKTPTTSHDQAVQSKTSLGNEGLASGDDIAHEENCPK